MKLMYLAVAIAAAMAAQPPIGGPGSDDSGNDSNYFDLTPEGGVLVDSGPLEVGPFEPEPPILDTPLFEFGHDPDVVPLGGGQLYGTMNKVGVHKDVNAAFPEIGDDINVVGSDNVARGTYVLDQGVEISPECFWDVRICEVVDVGDHERYVVVASVGQDPPLIRQTGSGTIETLFELWEKRSGEPPLLLRRSTSWVEHDTLLP